MPRIKLATIWLSGCSGCHMSLLDLDERLFELVQKADIVYSPLMDVKEYPENVDVVLVEGAIANEEQLDFIQVVRSRSRIVVSFGDCAVTGNITALRNNLKSLNSVLAYNYFEAADIQKQIPDTQEFVPRLLERVVPVHVMIPVDVFLPGCPPHADHIWAALAPLLNHETPHLKNEQIKFG